MTSSNIGEQSTGQKWPISGVEIVNGGAILGDCGLPWAPDVDERPCNGSHFEPEMSDWHRNATNLR
jgi:hypothetical protein